MVRLKGDTNLLCQTSDGELSAGAIVKDMQQVSRELRDEVMAPSRYLALLLQVSTPGFGFRITEKWVYGEADALCDGDCNQEINKNKILETY